MEQIQAPNKVKLDRNKKYLFLAGSIEMGVAVDWQKKVLSLLKNTEWVVFNPRRDDWDSSWLQDISNIKFRKQVEWELEALTLADKILMYFDPQTKSPISLLELGLFAKSDKLLVVCPKGFWRKGNVDIVCYKYNVKQVDTLEEAVLLLGGNDD